MTIPEFLAVAQPVPNGILNVGQKVTAMPEYHGVVNTGIETIYGKATQFFDTANAVFSYLSHPVMIINSIAGASYFICLFVGAIGLIFYVAGYKKSIKYVKGSLLCYILIQLINMGVNLL